MAKSSHTHGNVTYGARGRRWNFETPDGYAYSTPTMPGGRPTADKIAAIIAGGNKRTKGNGIDNLARANMSQIFHSAAKSSRHILSPIGTFSR
jgi:hypothetical protein